LPWRVCNNFGWFLYLSLRTMRNPYRLFFFVSLPHIFPTSTIAIMHVSCATEYSLLWSPLGVTGWRISIFPSPPPLLFQWTEFDGRIQIYNGRIATMSRVTLVFHYFFLQSVFCLIFVPFPRKFHARAIPFSNIVFVPTSLFHKPPVGKWIGMLRVMSSFPKCPLELDFFPLSTWNDGPLLGSYSETR
jgi:hypothetical protein